MSDVASSTTQQVESTPVITPVQKKGGAGKTVLIACGVLLACCLCSIIAVVVGASAVFGTVIGVAQNDIKNTVCRFEKNDAALRRMYENDTTEAFRANSSLEDVQQFSDAYKNVFANCEQFFNNLNFVTLISSSSSINYSNTNGQGEVEAVFNMNGRKVTVYMSEERAGGGLKLHRLNVQ
jgi:MinD-like ATPase involved in chromosome partitioning or flagellar assembly